MRERSSVFIAALCVALLASCASPTFDAGPAPGIYVLNMDKPVSNAAVAFVRITEAKVNGKPLRQDTVAQGEARQGAYELAALLENSGLFKSVGVIEDEDRAGLKEGNFLIEVKLNIEENDHAAANGGKAFASGFFTLGIVPITMNYAYGSLMTVRMSRQNEEVLTTSSSKAGAASSGRSYYAASPLAERSALRKFVRTENNKTIVDYLIKNNDKFCK